MHHQLKVGGGREDLGRKAGGGTWSREKCEEAEILGHVPAFWGHVGTGKKHGERTVERLAVPAFILPLYLPDLLVPFYHFQWFPTKIRIVPSFWASAALLQAISIWLGIYPGGHV